MTLDLDKLENLHQSTTPGPWSVKQMNQPEHDPWFFVLDGEGRGPVMETVVAQTKYLVTPEAEQRANMDFVVAAHEAFPAMLDRIRALTDELLLTQADLERCQDQRDDAEQRSEREYEDR